MNNLRYYETYLCFCIFFVLKLSSSTIKLSENDIYEIYVKYVKPNMNQEYMHRYVPLPLHKNNIPWKWENKDVGRVISLLEFERFVLENKLSCNKGLAINGADPEWYYLPYKKRIIINYEENPEKYDLHILDLPEKDFDFVIVNQTLEHLYNPIRCLKNIYKHMSVGGILYFNVPSINILHNTPFHYYTGFTPVGIGAIVKLAGFRILSIGQWGNLDLIKKIFESNSWPDYRATETPGLNNAGYPYIVWVFAEKEK